MRRQAYPYRRPPHELVDPDAWALVDGDESQPLPGAIADWDYQLDLTFRRVVTLDVRALREASSLPSDAPLALTTVWHASRPGLYGRAAYVPLQDAPGPVELALEFTLDSDDLGGVLRLDTHVVLASRLHEQAGPGPHRAGSVLWEDRVEVRLQGDAAQFPMAVADFSRTSLPDEAPWHLVITGGVDGAAMAALLLLINETNEPVVRAFRNAARPSPADRLILSAVRTDVAQRLLTHALDDDDFDDDTNFADGSLGDACRDLFAGVFEGRSVRDVRLERASDAGFFASTIQARTRLFQER